MPLVLSCRPTGRTRRATTEGCPYNRHHVTIGEAMEKFQNSNRRRSLRLKKYDYSQPGLYFITICVKDYLCLFGRVENGEMILNDAGRMIQTVWNNLPCYYDRINVNAFVVMPNHIHGIIEITDISNEMAFPVGAGLRACPGISSACRQDGHAGQPRVAPTSAQMSLFDVVHRYKTFTTKKYIDGVKQRNWLQFNSRLWQRNYYEHVIRSEESCLEISGYIQNNPLKWQEDKLFVNYG